MNRELKYAVNKTNTKVILFNEKNTVTEILDLIQKNEKDDGYQHLFYEGAEIYQDDIFFYYYDSQVVYIASKTASIPDEFDNKLSTFESDKEEEESDSYHSEDEQITVNIPQINRKDYKIIEYI